MNPSSRIRRTRVGAALVFAVVGATFMSASPAEARYRGKISFAKGRSSRTVSATVRFGNADCWSFSAAAEQRASISVQGTRTVGLFLSDESFELDAESLQEQVTAIGGKRDSMTLPYTGDYTACVATTRKSASYKLTLTIV